MKDLVLTPESMLRASPEFHVKDIFGGGKMVHSYSQKLLPNHYFNFLNGIIELFSFKSFIQNKGGQYTLKLHRTAPRVRRSKLTLGIFESHLISFDLISKIGDLFSFIHSFIHSQNEGALYMVQVLRPRIRKPYTYF